MRWYAKSALLLAALLAACAPHRPATLGPVDDPSRGTQLAGRWSLRLVLDSAVPAAYTATEVEGWIEFGPKYSPPWDPADSKGMASAGWRYEAGKYELDLRPFTGGASLADGHVLLPGMGLAPETEVLAIHYPGDTTAIALNPRITHGGISLMYTAAADTVISGRWGSRTLPPAMMRGTFTMRRLRQ